MNISNLKIGEPTALAAGLPEGVIFTFAASGPMMIFNLSNPRPDEANSFKSGQPAEFRLSRVAGILFVLARVGSVAWAEAPYAPQLESNIYLPDAVPDGGGYGLVARSGGSGYQRSARAAPDRIINEILQSSAPGDHKRYWEIHNSGRALCGSG